MQSILVKLPNWLGDILFSFDLLHTLSRNFSRIALLTSEQHAELFSIFSFANSQVIAYPPRSWPRLDFRTRRQVRQFQADAGVLLPNSLGSALVLKTTGVPRLFGYNTEFRKIFLHRSLPAPQHKMHQVEYYLQLLKLFNLNPEPYPHHTSNHREPLIVFHPGASKIQRRWHPDRFRDVARALHKQGFEILFVSGEPFDLEEFPVLLRPSLTEFAALLGKCALFIGNDSGPLHLAQQCGAPVVGIYGPGDPLVTGPRQISPGRIVYLNFPCSPCRQQFFKECDPASSGKPYCIEFISSRQVLQAALHLLENTKKAEHGSLHAPHEIR